MDHEERQQFLAMAQTIGMQAMELPPHKRPEFIKRAVTAIRRDFDRKHGADPSTAEIASKLETLTGMLVKLIEESGGTIGHA